MGSAMLSPRTGIHWTRPRVSSDGKSNIIFDARGHMSVSIDPHETDPRHRYKAAYYGPWSHGRPGPLGRRYSLEQL